MKAQPASFCAGVGVLDHDEEGAARGCRELLLLRQEGRAHLELHVFRQVVHEGGGGEYHGRLLIDEVGVGHFPGVVVFPPGRFMILCLLTMFYPVLERLAPLLAETGLFSVCAEE